MDNQIYEAYGPHLILDGYDCVAPGLGTVQHIYKFLDAMPALIGMTKIMPPYVFEYHGKLEEDWGVSGFVLIAESHISVHTYPQKRFIVVDIFSCKDFNHKEATKVIKDYFGIQRIETKVLSRGLEFPRNIQLVTEHLKKER